jgi:hypothetical protein
MGATLMLRNAALERVSVAYRRGYRDGYNGTNQGANVRPEYIKPVAEFDYAEGLMAGANDRKWDDHYANRNRSGR